MPKVSIGHQCDVTVDNSAKPYRPIADLIDVITMIYLYQ